MKVSDAALFAALGDPTRLRICLLYTSDAEYRQVLLRAISSTRQPEALEFLLNMVRNGREAEALNAIEALALHRDSADIRRQVERAAAEREGVCAHFKKSFARPENA